MQKLLRDDGLVGLPGSVGASFVAAADVAASSAPPAAPLFEVLWRRRLVVALTMGVCLTFALGYIVLATRVYRATAKVLLKENGPNAYSESTGFNGVSESYVQSQEDVVLSTPTLSRVVERAGATAGSLLAEAAPDPVAWLRENLKVEVGKKTDVISVTLDSSRPHDARAIVQAALDAYLDSQSADKRSTGDEIVKVLEREKESLRQKRAETLQAMLRKKREQGVVSFGQDKGNTTIERTAALSTSLTNAEVLVMDLKAQQAAAKAALETPETISAYVESQQFKGREFGDREYDELRSQLAAHELAASHGTAVQGANNPRVQQLQTTIDDIKRRIAAKERSIAEAQLVGVTQQLMAAERNVSALRNALGEQQGQAMNMAPGADEYARLEADAQRMQRQMDLLDSRIAEVGVNAAGPASVKVLEPAHVEAKPVKPNKTLALAAALFVGWVAGIGLAMLREWQDARLRTPEEIMTLLGTPVLATVPQVNPRLSPVTRGQLVFLDPRSAAAEAYRAARTSLHLGSASAAKTILLASPATGDGKSTTASNLAIAFAQSGERVLLIDCDLRKPVQHLIFEVPADYGVSNVMTGEAKLGSAICPTRVPGLYLLPCGPVPGSPSELLSSKRFHRLMQALGETFDRIVIDSPPLMNVADGRILAAAADVTLLVLRMNRSMRALGAMAVDGLDKVGANVLGAIANDVPADRADQNYSSGSWQYAAHSRRLLAGITSAATQGNRLPGGNGATNGNGHTNGNGNGHAEGPSAAPAEENGTSSATITEPLTITEPDWTGDGR